MKKSIESLLQIEFKDAGHWLLRDDESIRMVWELSEDKKSLEAPNVLYAFAIDETVKYIGKTTRSVKKRFLGYCRPGNTTATNYRCNKHIKEALKSGETVRVYIFSHAPLLQYGDYAINLAAGLEDSLIAEFKPDWNGGKSGKKETETAETEEAVMGNLMDDEKDICTKTGQPFTLTLQPTYYQKGFINVGVAASKHLGKHDETIALQLGVNGQKIFSRINRTANANSSVRIIGNNRPVAEWFQSQFQQGGTVNGLIMSPSDILLFE